MNKDNDTISPLVFADEIAKLRHRETGCYIEQDGVFFCLPNTESPLLINTDSTRILVDGWLKDLTTDSLRSFIDSVPEVYDSEPRPGTPEFQQKKHRNLMRNIHGPKRSKYK